MKQFLTGLIARHCQRTGCILSITSRCILTVSRAVGKARSSSATCLCIRERRYTTVPWFVFLHCYRCATDTGNKIGPNVSIGPGAIVGEGVRVRDSIILDNVELKVGPRVLFVSATIPTCSFIEPVLYSRKHHFDGFSHRSLDARRRHQRTGP